MRSQLSGADYRMDITVLAYLEPDEKEPDVAVQQVADGLTESGHKTSILTIRHDVDELIRGLKSRKPQLVFNLVESFGDDILGGVIGVAGVLDLLQIPYTGGGPGEIFLQEDKALTKKLLAFEGIPYPDFATFPADANFETGGNLRMPLFVKPLRMDASIGIDERSLVRNTQQMMERVLYIQRTFGDAALAEEYIEGREFYVGVMGNDELAAFPPIEIDFSGLKEGSLKVMDNEAKFDESSERYHGTKAVIANIDAELKAKLHKASVDAYRALRVCDYGRVDLRLTETGEVYVIEVNANCYLEQHSEFATAAAAHGMPYRAGRRRHRQAGHRALEASQPRAETAQESAQRGGGVAREVASQRLGCSPLLLFTGTLAVGSDGIDTGIDRDTGADEARAPGSVAGVSGKYAPRWTKFMASDATSVVTATTASSSAARGYTCFSASARFARLRTKLRVFSGKWPVQRNTDAMSWRSWRRMSSAAGRVSCAAPSSASFKSSKIARRSPSKPAAPDSVSTA